MTAGIFRIHPRVSVLAFGFGLELGLGLGLGFGLGVGIGLELRQVPVSRGHCEMGATKGGGELKLCVDSCSL